MFSNSGCTSATPTADCKGEVDFQGSKISWQKVILVDGNFIRLTVVGPDINTTIDIPSEPSPAPLPSGYQCRILESLDAQH